MNIFVFHLGFFFALFCCWLVITGRMAEWQWRDWGNSRFGWLFLGAGVLCTDVPSFKRYYFWLGWVMLAGVLITYAVLMYGYLAGA